MSPWRLAARCAPRWCCATTCAFARPSSAPICWALPRRGATSLSPTPISFPACNSAAPWPGARRVRVRLLLQGKVEYRMQYHATRSLYDQLLRDGIEIYEYMPGYLHAKVAVIDNVATVGSSNLDPFSLLLAREANVVIDDQPFAWDCRNGWRRPLHPAAGLSTARAAAALGGRGVVCTAADWRGADGNLGQVLSLFRRGAVRATRACAARRSVPAPARCLPGSRRRPPGWGR